MVSTINHHMTVNHSDNGSIMPLHYLHELPNKDELHLTKLFESLDMDKNGKIDILELSIALHDKEHVQVSKFFFGNGI